MICRLIPLIGLVALAALGGCESPVEEWQPVEAPKTSKVELARLSHTVRFEPSATKMSPSETTRLVGFLDDSDLVPGEHVYLQAPRDDSLSRAREATIRRILARRGILVGTVPESKSPLGEQLALGDVVTIELERYVVTPPDCPNWSKPTGGDPTNTVASNFGCATATNLGLMVANPRDLIAGRRAGPADAEPALRAIQNYRAGKPIVLPDDLSSNSSPGASAAAPGASAGGGSGSSGGSGG
ncbi:MAG TPA: CpaD family pilus assembly lipoprotein [Stellaceae bacterium]|nr:CpaD family pilus assembly lipoprotein [Stellaceae bacterium]